MDSRFWNPSGCKEEEYIQRNYESFVFGLEQRGRGLEMAFLADWHHRLECWNRSAQHKLTKLQKIKFTESHLSNFQHFLVFESELMVIKSRRNTEHIYFIFQHLAT